MIRVKSGESVRRPTRQWLKLSNFLGVNTTVAEENLPFNYSPKSYNFSLEKGVLETGFGVSQAVSKIGNVNWEIKKRGLNVRFLKMYYYRTHNLERAVDRVVAYGEDGHLYETALSVAYTTFTDIGAYGEIKCAANYVYNGRSGLLFSTENGLYFLCVNSVTRLSYSRVFTTMCEHNDRVFAVFAIDEYKLYFSDDFNPANWNVSLSEGGYVSFTEEMGKIVKVLSFGGYVYIFFEHGIRRLSAYNDQTEFELREIYLSVGSIMKDTVTVCGDRVIFQASDGVYSFDGVGVRRILEGIRDLFDGEKQGSFAAFQSGKYYLACNLKMDSTIATGTNSLIVYDIWKDTHEIAHDVGLAFLLPVDTENISGVLTETSYPVSFLGRIDRSGSVNSTATYKVWCSPVSSLGRNRGKKLLRTIRLRSDGNVTLHVVLDGTSHEYGVSEGLTVLRVMRTFDTLQIKVTSAAATARLTQAELEVDYYGE